MFISKLVSGTRKLLRGPQEDKNTDPLQTHTHTSKVAWLSKFSVYYLLAYSKYGLLTALDETVSTERINIFIKKILRYKKFFFSYFKIFFFFVNYFCHFKKFKLFFLYI